MKSVQPVYWYFYIDGTVVKFGRKIRSSYGNNDAIFKDYFLRHSMGVMQTV